MLSVSTLAYQTYFSRTLREATTRNRSAFAHLWSGGPSSLFLWERGNGENKEQRLFSLCPFLFPERKKRTPDRRSRFAGYLNSSCPVISPFSSLPSLLWWYIVCFHLFYSRIFKYLKIPTVQRRWANSVIIYLLLTRMLNTGLSWERNNSFAPK